MKNWYISNIKNPYASKLTKKELAKQTGLTIKQISKWLNDQRARNKKKECQEKKRKFKKILLKNKNILKNFFRNVNAHPTEFEVKELSKLTGLTKKKIKYWFSLKNLC